MYLNDFRFIIDFGALLMIMGILQIFSSLFLGKGTANTRLQQVILLAFSFFCICSSDIRFGISVLNVILISYFCTLSIEKAKSEMTRKIVRGGGISTLLLILGYFKYSNFFVNEFQRLFGKDKIVLDLVLPLGISFYTFTAISYIIDVYRKKYNAERSFLNVALYISFFPKLVAGPIVRGDCFLPQVRNYKGLSLENLEIGIQIFSIGLFKKIVLADRLCVFVNDVFYAPSAFNMFTVILAVLSYALQIYFDFSGYSDMAIGTSKMLGFDIPLNFNRPYMAKNISDFWSRWHISLSSWFRDYVYIPLGGSRKGKRRTFINLILVMVLSGLWHGAGITFLLWGLLHGIASCIDRAFSREKTRYIGTFIVVNLLWIFFRAESVKNALDIFRAMVMRHSGMIQPYTWSFFAMAILGISIIVAVKKNKGISDEGYSLVSLNTIGGMTAFLVFVGLTIMLGYFGNTAFIYGRF